LKNQRCYAPGLFATNLNVCGLQLISATFYRISAVINFNLNKKALTAIAEL
jgi:hypothetical protein